MRKRAPTERTPNIYDASSEDERRRARRELEARIVRRASQATTRPPTSVPVCVEAREDAWAQMVPLTIVGTTSSQPPADCLELQPGGWQTRRCRWYIVHSSKHPFNSDDHWAATVAQLGGTRMGGRTERFQYSSGSVSSRVYYLLGTIKHNGVFICLFLLVLGYNYVW